MSFIIFFGTLAFPIYVFTSILGDEVQLNYNAPSQSIPLRNQLDSLLFTVLHSFIKYMSLTRYNQRFQVSLFGLRIYCLVFSCKSYIMHMSSCDTFSARNIRVTGVQRLLANNFFSIFKFIACQNKNKNFT